MILHDCLGDIAYPDRNWLTCAIMPAVVCGYGVAKNCIVNRLGKGELLRVFPCPRTYVLVLAPKLQSVQVANNLRLVHAQCEVSSAR